MDSIISIYACNSGYTLDALAYFRGAVHPLLLLQVHPHDGYITQVLYSSPDHFLMCIYGDIVNGLPVILYVFLSPL